MIRVVSASALIALLVVAVWWHPLATLGLACAIAALGAMEVASLAGQVDTHVPARFVAPLAAVVCGAAALGPRFPPPFGSDVVLILLLALLVAVGVATLASGAPDPSVLPRAAVGVMAPLYLGLPLGAIARIRLERGSDVVAVLAVMVIASDTAQYVVGRTIGRRKLAPLISPAKTVEGAIGGLVAAAAIGATLGVTWIPHATVPSGLLLGVLVGGFGMAGDLFESLIKRGAGVKDSSSLIPGHGGVLDRIDSWLFAGPVYYVFLRYLA